MNSSYVMSGNDLLHSSVVKRFFCSLPEWRLLVLLKWRVFLKWRVQSCFVGSDLYCSLRVCAFSARFFSSNGRRVLNE